MDRRNGNDIVVLPGECLVNEGNFPIKYCGLGQSKNIALTQSEVENMGDQASEIRDASRRTNETASDSERGLLRTVQQSFLAFTRPVIDKVMSRGSMGVLHYFDKHLGPHSPSSLFLLTMISLYDAAHCTAWGSIFPSVVEQYL